MALAHTKFLSRKCCKVSYRPYPSQSMFKAVKRLLGFMQTDATTPNIVAPTMLGVAASVLAVVFKRLQQLPTMLGPVLHRGKDTTHKSL